MDSRFTMLSVVGAAAAAVLVLPPRAAADQVSQVGTPSTAATLEPAGVRAGAHVAHPTTRLCSGDVPRKRRRHSIPSHRGRQTRLQRLLASRDGGEGRPRSALGQPRAGWSPREA